jgi:hypothetical protein
VKKITSYYGSSMHNKYPLHFNSKLLACFQQTNKASTIGRTTLHTTWSSQAIFLWLHTFCSLLQSGTRGSVQQSLGSKRDGESQRIINQCAWPQVSSKHHCRCKPRATISKEHVCYRSWLIVRAKVVNKGQHEDRRLAMARMKRKAVSLKGSWLPKSKSKCIT